MFQYVSCFIADSAYRISFDYAGSNLFGGWDDIKWHLFIDDVNVFQTPVFHSTDTFWTTASYNFIATLTVHKIGVRLISTAGITGSGGIDNFILTRLSGSSCNLDIDTSVTVSNLSITANDTGAYYQWLDCDNSFSQISGETGQSFTAIISGSYAVQLAKNCCMDTSVCTIIQMPCAPLLLTYSITSATPGLNDGAVKVNVTGGEPPYQYSLDNLTFQFSNSFTLLDTGTYQIYVIDSNGCPGQGTFIIDETVGITSFSDFDHINVYVAGEYLIIGDIKRKMFFTLYNLSGREVLTATLLNGEKRIEIKNLPTGVYVYHIEDELKVGKVFIEK